MMKQFLALPKYFICATLLLSRAVPSLGQEPDADAPVTPPAQIAGGATNPQVLPETKEEIREWVRWRYWNDNYDALERAATTWRASKAAYPSGNWKLTLFYEGFQQFPGGEATQQWVEKARAWVQKKPESITARVALAVVLNRQGWRIRGRGVAAEVPEGANHGFTILLTEAAQVLRDARALDAKCPHWWAVAQSAALGLGLPREMYEAIYNEAVAFEPEYYPFYENKCMYLLPRWNGSEGDWEKFSLEAANQFGGDKGDLLYARLVWALGQFENKPLPEPLVSYDKLNKGFMVMDKQGPNNIEVKGTWALLCMVTGTAENEPARKTQVRRILAEIEALEPGKNAQWRSDAKALIEWVAQA